MAFADLPESVRAEYERIGREREAASREADRISLWALIRVCAEMIGWTAAGLGIAFFAFWVNDYDLGMIFLYGGMVVNIGGVLASVVMAYRRGEERGDW